MSTQVGLVERHGYPAEEHDVVTEDGYKLKVHRIPDSPLSSNKRNKKVVFLQHGIIASSDTWVFFGPGRDLGRYRRINKAFAISAEDGRC